MALAGGKTQLVLGLAGHSRSSPKSCRAGKPLVLAPNLVLVLAELHRPPFSCPVLPGRRPPPGTTLLRPVYVIGRVTSAQTR